MVSGSGCIYWMCAPRLYADSFDISPKYRILSPVEKKRFGKFRAPGDICRLCLARSSDIREKTTLARAVLNLFARLRSDGVRIGT